MFKSVYLKKLGAGTMDFKDQIISGLISVSQDTKAAATVGTATATAGTATYLDWIPDDIGKLATVIGIILSVVLIYVHLRKSHFETQLAKAELEALRQRERDRQSEINRRRGSGEHTRRSTDHV